MSTVVSSIDSMCTRLKEDGADISTSKSVCTASYGTTAATIDHGLREHGTGSTDYLKSLGVGLGTPIEEHGDHAGQDDSLQATAAGLQQAQGRRVIDDNGVQDGGHGRAYLGQVFGIADGSLLE